MNCRILHLLNARTVCTSRLDKHHLLDAVVTVDSGLIVNAHRRPEFQTLDVLELCFTHESKCIGRRPDDGCRDERILVTGKAREGQLFSSRNPAAVELFICILTHLIDLGKRHVAANDFSRSIKIDEGALKVHNIPRDLALHHRTDSSRVSLDDVGLEHGPLFNLHRSRSPFSRLIAERNLLQTLAVGASDGRPRFHHQITVNKGK